MTASTSPSAPGIFSQTDELIHSLLQGCFGHWITIIPIGIIGAIALARLGNGFGLDRLFWNDTAWVRFKAGVSIGCLAVTTLVVGLLLENDRTVRHPDSAKMPDTLGQLGSLTEKNVIELFIAGLVLALIGHFRTQPRKKVGSLQDSSSKPLRAKWTQWIALWTPPLVIVGAYVLAIRTWGQAINRMVNQPDFFYSNVFLSDCTAMLQIRSRIMHLPDAPPSILTMHYLALLLAVIWSIYWIWRLLVNQHVKGTPAAALCSLAAVTVLAGGILVFNHISFIFPLSVFTLTGFVFSLRTNGTYTFIVRNLDYSKDKLVPFDASRITPTPRENLSLESTGHVISPKIDAPLVIICSSGGGIRAGVWTIRCLQQLSHLPRSDDKNTMLLPNFAQRVRLIFGASGGMLGTTRFVTALRSGKFTTRQDAEHAVKQVEKDGLSQLTSRLIFHDIPQGALPFIPGLHRGFTIEDNWKHNFQLSDRDSTFGSLLQHERNGSCPSLTFSPMMIEDGRRLLISNLDLSHLTQFRGPELKSDEPEQLYSQSAVEMQRLFGEQTFQKFNLLTAVRLNASFPYVMPASSIPTNPRRRVVDAGYYDNYGTGLAADWLQATMNDPKRWEWLKANCNGVLVVQIRDGVLDLTKPMDTQKPADDGFVSKMLSSLSVAFEPLSAPILGLLGFRSAVQLFNNDAKLSGVLHRMNKAYERDIGSTAAKTDFATSVAFEFARDASLSWALASEELKCLEEQAQTPEFRTRVERISHWWNDRSQPKSLD